MKGEGVAKYVIEADLSSGDCSFCPCYQRVLNDAAECSLAGREMVGELRKSNSRSCDHVMCYDRPDWCPLVSYLIDDRKVAKPYANHGDHGPEPMSDGDAWSVWYCCGNCDHPISRHDRFCSTCGARLDWSE